MEQSHQDAYSKHGKKMREKLADEIKGFGDKFQDDRAWNQGTRISKRPGEDLTSAARILDFVRKVKVEACQLIQDGVTETALDDFIEENAALLQSLFPIEYYKREAGMRLRDLADRLTKILGSNEFDEAHIEDLDDRYRAAQQSKQAVETRVKQELAVVSRLKMSTIGSSHRLFTSTAKEEDDADIVGQMAKLAIGRQSGDDREGAVIIFDESGCIPSYELLGLDRLDCPISAILTVGDKKQLPPYNPTSNTRDRNSQRRRDDDGSGLKSLLDVSETKEKIALRTQYRVPKDIANILNTRVYNGQYKTHRRAVVERGLEFLHVDKSQRQEFRKYVNSNEVDVVLRLAREKSRDGLSVMILTPVSKHT